MLKHSPRAFVRCSSAIAYAAAIVALFAAPAGAQFTSGSTGVHGAFPPTAPPTGTVYLIWNMTTGLVRYCNGYDTTNRPQTCTSELGTAPIPNIPVGGLNTGIFEFTNMNVVPAASPGYLYIYVVGNPLNNPLTVLSQNDIRFAPNVYFYLDGLPGRSHNGSNLGFSLPGGLPGPGGARGADGGIGGSTPSNGNPGYGPAGGAGGQTAATTTAGARGLGAGSSPASFSLTPLRGGSGGGGGAGLAPNVTIGVQDCGSNLLGYGGAGGGGGGGGLLLAATNEIAIGTLIDLSGGAGGDNPYTGCRPAGGAGEGGSIRLVSSRLSGAGTINVSGGAAPFGGAGNGAGGRVRIEANTNAYTGSIQGASSGSFTQFPVAAIPSNLPALHIVSIGGVAVPATTTGDPATPDVSFPTPPANPVTVALSASQIPVGTTVSLRVTPAIGAATTTTSTALTGTLTSSTASASIDIPPGPGAISASATFTLPPGSAMLMGIPNLDGTKPQRVEVVAGLGGESKTYVIAENGARFEVGLR